MIVITSNACRVSHLGLGLQLVVSILAILLLSKVIEPNWGSKEYIKYLALVNLGSGVGTFVLVYIAYALDRNNEGNLL